MIKPINTIFSGNQKTINVVLLLLGTNLFLAALSFLTNIAFANLLGKENFGNFSYALSVGGYCLAISFFGLERTLVRDLISFPEKSSEYISASILIRGAFLSLTLILISITNYHAAPEEKLGTSGFIILVATGLQSLHMGPVYDSKGKTPLHSIHLLIERIIYFSGIWIIILFFSESFSLSTIAYCLIFSTMLGLSLQHFWIFSKTKFYFSKESLNLCIRILRQNYLIWISAISAMSFGALSKIALKHTSGSAKLGEYALAWQIIAMGFLLLNQIERVGNPKLILALKSNQSREQRFLFLLKYYMFSSLSISLIAIPVILFPDFILSFFNPQYATAAQPLRILGFYLLLISIGRISSQYLINTKRQNLDSIMTIISGLLAVAGYYFIVPAWEATGAALVITFAQGICILICTTIAVSHTRINYPR